MLAQLSNDSDENVTEISVGLRSLIQLLGSLDAGTGACRRRPRRPHRNSADNRADVARGRHRALVRLLTDGEVLPQCDARAEAAGALWSLAEGSHETKAAIADAGAIPPMLGPLPILIATVMPDPYARPLPLPLPVRRPAPLLKRTSTSDLSL